MFRVDTSTAATNLRAPGPAGTPGYFQSGDPSTGRPATIPGADFFNIFQEELCHVIEYFLGAGALNKADSTQLRQAVENAIQTALRNAAPGPATTAARGLVELATDAETKAGTDATRAVTPKSLAAALADLLPAAVPGGLLGFDAAGALTVYAPPWPDSLRGPQGPQGPRGPQGPKGDTGARGSQGSSGGSYSSSSCGGGAGHDHHG